jgi:hypothetical protein
VVIARLERDINDVRGDRDATLEEKRWNMSLHTPKLQCTEMHCTKNVKLFEKATVKLRALELRSLKYLP